MWGLAEPKLVDPCGWIVGLVNNSEPLLCNLGCLSGRMGRLKKIVTHVILVIDYKASPVACSYDTSLYICRSPRACSRDQGKNPEERELVQPR